MRHICFLTMLFFIAMLCSCKGYEPKLTSEMAIEAALEEGQQYFVEAFDEWQSWSARTAEFQAVELRTLIDKECDGMKYIWHVVFQNDEGTRSVHFVVKDENQKVLSGWDSKDAAVDYKEEPKEEYEYTAEDVIIRAVLYFSDNEEIEWIIFRSKHIYVYLDYYGWWDVRDLSDWRWREGIISMISKDIIPLGQQAWRVIFCEHEGEHQPIWDVDYPVVVGADGGIIYGQNRMVLGTSIRK